MRRKAQSSVSGSTPEEMTATVTGDVARFARLVKAIGVQKGMRLDAVDAIVAVVDARLEANRKAARR